MHGVFYRRQLGLGQQEEGTVKGDGMSLESLRQRAGKRGC